MEFQHLNNRYQQHIILLDKFKKTKIDDPLFQALKGSVSFSRVLNKMDNTVLNFQLLETSKRKEKEANQFLKTIQGYIQELNEVAVKYNYSKDIVEGIRDYFSSIPPNNLKYWKWNLRTKLYVKALEKRTAQLEAQFSVCN